MAPCTRCDLNFFHIYNNDPKNYIVSLVHLLKCNFCLQQILLVIQGLWLNMVVEHSYFLYLINQRKCNLDFVLFVTPFASSTTSIPAFVHISPYCTNKAQIISLQGSSPSCNNVPAKIQLHTSSLFNPI